MQSSTRGFTAVCTLARRMLFGHCACSHSPSEQGEWQGVPIRPGPAGVPRCKPSSTQPLDGLGLSIRVVVTAMS